MDKGEGRRRRRWTYRSDVVEQLGQIRNNTVDILVVLNEPVSLAVGNLANDVERIELQPTGEIACLGSALDVKLLGLLQEELGGVVDERFILD